MYNNVINRGGFISECSGSYCILMVSLVSLLISLFCSVWSQIGCVIFGVGMPQLLSHVKATVHKVTCCYKHVA